MSSIFSLAFLRAFFTAGTGPYPIIAGSRPTLAIPLIAASGFKFNSFALFSDIKISAEAPSAIAEELPAVTVPNLGSNTGLRADRLSKFVSGRITSSVSASIVVPSRPCARVGMISFLKFLLVVAR